MNKKFYAVWKGAKTGVFDSWAEVQQYTNGRSDAQFMGFPSKVEAQTAFASTYTKALMKRSLKSSPALSKSKVSAASTPDEIQSAQVQADIEIYCDGACSPNPGKSGTGLCVYQAGKLSALYYGLYEVMGTNNTAELNGLLQSMKLAQFVLQKGDKRIVILSDSKYSIDCITKWSRGWKAKGWKKGKGEEIKNLELIKTCFNLYESLKTNVSIKHVKGHANIEGNELADRMAVYARLKKQTDFVRFEETLDIKAILAMESG